MNTTTTHTCRMFDCYCNNGELDPCAGADWCPYCDTCGDDGAFGAECADCENGTKSNHDHARWVEIETARHLAENAKIRATGLIPW